MLWGQHSEAPVIGGGDRFARLRAME